MNNSNNNLIFIFPTKKIMNISLNNKKLFNKIKFFIKNYLKLDYNDDNKIKEYINNNILKIVLNELDRKTFKLLGIKEKEVQEMIKKNKVYVIIFNTKAPDKFEVFEII